MSAVELPPIRTDTAAAAQAALANQAYAKLLDSGTAVTTTQYVKALAERGIRDEAARTRIKRGRSDKRLVTVTHQGEALIPTFQLLRDFDHNELAGDAVAALLEAGYGPWEVWDWAETPNPWIGRRRPADVIRTSDSAAIRRALLTATGEGPEA